MRPKRHRRRIHLDSEDNAAISKKRNHATKRIALTARSVRFFAGGEDLSHELPDAPLPDAVTKGAEPFMIVGAIAGG